MMRPSETATLLAMIAAYDRRTVGEADVAAWHAELEPYDLAAAAAAVRDYYRTSRDWLMPADLVRLIRAARAARIPELVPLPPIEPDDVTRYLAWQVAWRDGCADGLTSDQAERRADDLLGVVRQPLPTSQRPIAALVGTLADSKTIPGARKASA